MSDMPGGMDPLKEVVEQMKRDAFNAGWKAAMETVATIVQTMEPPDSPENVPSYSYQTPVVAVRQSGESSSLPTVGTTPHYVYQAVQRKQGMTGAEVIAAVRAEGHDVAEPQIRTALSRLEKRQLLANRHRKWFLK
jgi:hypothetical protein